MTIRRHRLSPLWAVALMSSLAACSLTPDYERPALPVASQWPQAYPGVVLGEVLPQAEVPWERLFADRQLHQLIELSLEYNRDLQIALLNIEKARAQYRIQRSAQLPDIELSAKGEAGRAPVSGGASSGESSRRYDAAVGATTWELDLFGRIASLSEQQLQQYLATESTLQAVKTSLIAEVATAYLNLRAKAALLDLTRQTEEGWLATSQLQQHLHATGNASDIDLLQVQSELEATKSQRIALESDVSLAKNTLQLLIGTSLPSQLSIKPSLEGVLGMQELPVGLPSEVLQRRPDVIAAEHLLMSRNANIGAARAAFFPSISLTGSVGRASGALSDLVDGGTRAWSFLPQLHLPIFAGGRLQADLELAQVQKDIAIAEYEHAIQVAFREIADGLVVQAHVRDQFLAQERRAFAAEQAHTVVMRRYENGVANYLEVLEAERSLYSAQAMKISVQQASHLNLVLLYKALGG